MCPSMRAAAPTEQVWAHHMQHVPTCCQRVLVHLANWACAEEARCAHAAAKWLQVLQHLLAVLQVPSTIVTGEAPSPHLHQCWMFARMWQADAICMRWQTGWSLAACTMPAWVQSFHQYPHAGGLRRAEGQDRIEFLAEVRNRALAPLWRETGGSLNGTATGAGFKADRVVFINDVYFCARDVVRPFFLLHPPVTGVCPSPGGTALALDGGLHCACLDLHNCRMRLQQPKVASM